MSVAVIIPTHNRAGQVLTAVRSVLEQTMPPDRVVVVDDGSDDGTPSMLEREVPEVEVIVQDNAGVSAARNRGVAAVEEKWIAFLDSDDQWQPNKLELQWQELALHAAARTPANLVHCDEIWIRNGNQVLQRLEHAKRGGDIFLDCLPLCAISPSAVMLRRDELLSLGGFDESLPACEDYDLWLRWTSRHPVAYVDQPLVVKTGGHADQLSRRYPVMDRFRIEALCKLLGGADHELTEKHRAAVIETLTAKTRIVAQGARRRGRASEAEALEGRTEAVISRSAIGRAVPGRTADAGAST